MSRKLKRLTLQYSYLLLEKEEVDEICSDVEPQLREYMEKHYPEYYDTFYSTSDEPEKIEEPKEDEEKKEIPKNGDIKKLYRKIASKIHPDKTGKDKDAELFAKAAKAYRENDIATILDIAGSLNMEIVELSPESIFLLSENVKTLSEGIDSKKKTASWAWHHSENEEEKAAIIKMILLAKGVQDMKKNKVKVNFSVQPEDVRAIAANSMNHIIERFKNRYDKNIELIAAGCGFRKRYGYFRGYRKYV